MGKETELLDHWNKFVKHLLGAKKEWDVFTELRQSQRNVEGLPIRAQKVLNAVQWRGKFEIALARLIDYWRGYGGVESLLLLEEAKEVTSKLEDEEKGD